MLTDNLSLKLEIEEIKKKLSNHSKNIELVFSYLDELIDKKENEKPRRQIGYKTDRDWKRLRKKLVRMTNLYYQSFPTNLNVSINSFVVKIRSFASNFF
jgi:hypothetical protein